MWKKGPLPFGTYHWGGVIPVGVTVDDARILKAEEVAWWNNCLEAPGPNMKGGD